MTKNEIIRKLCDRRDSARKSREKTFLSYNKEQTNKAYCEGMVYGLNLAIAMVMKMEEQEETE